MVESASSCAILIFVPKKDTNIISTVIYFRNNSVMKKTTIAAL